MILMIRIITTANMPREWRFTRQQRGTTRFQKTTMAARFILIAQICESLGEINACKGRLPRKVHH